MNHESPQPSELDPAVKAPPAGGFEPTPSEQRLARWKFAEAVGHQALQDQPNLFDALLAGSWRSLANFVDDFIEESGLVDGIAALPSAYSQLVSVDRGRVAEYLRRHLLVLPVGQTVWVFDARNVVNSTVAEREREADNWNQYGRTDDPTI